MAKSRAELPESSLEHLKRLTDDTGLFEHAKFTTPLRKEGYTTDDNARALIVTVKYYARFRKIEALQLLDKYFAFVLHSHNDDGTVSNFMDFDRSWMTRGPANDAFGRVLWALGALLAQAPSPTYIPIAKEHIDISVPLIEGQSLRGMTYSILGLAGYLKRFPDADDLRERMGQTAEIMVSEYEENSRPGWSWFEDILIYDNAMLPYALFTAAKALDNKKYLDLAKKTCDFLLANTFTENPFNANEKGHFSFVGCQGWFPRGGKKAQFDQQPLEAAGTVLMLKAAYQATGDKRYLKLQRTAFDWFLGKNDLRIPLYDKKSKGCSDGLGVSGVSANQGAESTISFLLSLLTMRQDKYR
ncbi:MAG: hypothetical protein ABII09_02170 [Planctomycetota bacterium]